MTVPALDGPFDPTLFTVINGCPTPEELAAVTALLTVVRAAASASASAIETPPATWDRPDAFPPASWMART
ncbi:acyl-CoA carboxylase epsilon subunit [Streptomyces sp. NPDC058682]|uniref:acyl-CoA carboxylase epsilon subunit n=1 Tax=unclassified Streptomyces TaxID=2593676 RepID=UPI002254F702|nr:acyl-CoA carboxylase epsilon subunit [Streptomyces sp. NBC_01214]MCX4807342.1 acyl-CoA carboxylase epsilon subunit [Streptomyces sp. NBC_01214]